MNSGTQEPHDKGSEYDRLFYPYLFEGGAASADEVLAQVQHSTMEKSREIAQMRQATLAQTRSTIVAAGVAMAEAFSKGAMLLAFGNGGSATDAQDLVADLSNPPAAWGKPLPAVSLTNDVAVLTAVGNDVGFDNIFARQVIAFGRPGDIAFGISTSGNSTNVVSALEQAKKQKLITVGLAGYDGGNMARSPAVDYCATVVSDYIPRIQEAQATIYHAMLDVVWAVLNAG